MLARECIASLARGLHEPGNRRLLERLDNRGWAEPRTARPVVRCEPTIRDFAQKTLLLTILHYCYSNKPLGGVPLGSVPKIKSPGPASRFERQYGAGQAPMFRLTRSATRALPETRGDLHPSFCQDRPAVPQVRRAGFRGRHYRSRYGRPIRNAAVLLTGRYHPTASERRGTAPRSAADGSQEPVPCRNRLR